jgi:nucleotide-binding universal stress UspA family protein
MPSASTSPARGHVDVLPTNPPVPAIQTKPTPSKRKRTFRPIRRIPCPVDFSDFSRAAVERAVAIAKPFGAEITAVFVLPFVFPTEGDASSVEAPVAPAPEVQDALAEDLEEFLRPARDAGLEIRRCVRSPRAGAMWEAEVSQRLRAAALADGAPGCPVTAFVRSGRPHREILRLAEAQQAGVLVLGSGERRLGSTASRVLREANAPVLIVRSAPEERPS